MAQWVTHVVLREEDLQARARVVGKLVTLCDKLVTLRNFNSGMSICSGLLRNPVLRLNQTWNLLDAGTRDTWKNIRELFGNTRAYSRLRQAMKKIPPPKLPYIGIYLTDLTFIEEHQRAGILLPWKIDMLKSKLITHTISELLTCIQPLPQLSEIPGYFDKLFAQWIMNGKTKMCYIFLSFPSSPISK